MKNFFIWRFWDKIITARKSWDCPIFSRKQKAVRVFRKKLNWIFARSYGSFGWGTDYNGAKHRRYHSNIRRNWSEITEIYLFGLGVSNLAMNRSVVRGVEMRLKGASEEELDELARQEILGVVRQLKAQEDIMKNRNWTFWTYQRSWT